MSNYEKLKQESLAEFGAEEDIPFDIPSEIHQEPEKKVENNLANINKTTQKSQPASNLPTVNNLKASQDFLKKAIGSRWDKGDEKYAYDLLEDLYMKAKSNQKLMTAVINDKEGLANCLSKAMRLKFEPSNKDQYHIIPYDGKLEFQVGYVGVLTLAYRAGLQSVSVKEVYENDDFEMEFGLKPKLLHRRNITPGADRGRVIGYYAVLNEQIFDYITREEAEKHGKQYSKSYHNSKSGWQTNFDAMAKKTVLLKALNYYPKSTKELRDAMALEQEKDDPIDV